MKHGKSSNQNYAVILTLAGVIAYIAVDAGIFSWVSAKFESTKTAKQNEVKTPEEGLKAYSEKLSTELKSVEKEIKTEKGNLAKLQKEVTQYERNIAEQKKSLGNLDQEIKALSKLKQTLVSARKTASLDTAPAVRPPAGGVTDARIWQTPPSSFQELEASLQNLSTIAAAIEPVVFGTRKFMRLQTNISYGDEDSIFLTSRGKRQAAGFTEGALDLGYGTIKLAYNLADQQVLERAGVIKNFLIKRFGDRIKISSLKVQDDMEIADGLEIWVAKEDGAE